MRSSPERVQLVVGGSAYRDWLTFDIDSDVFEQADAFQVATKMPEPQMVGAFREGVTLDLYLADDRQMAGFIDDVQAQGGPRDRTSVQRARARRR